ncbi:cupin domain-containing protein [Scleromatobacter humisilvae]|uniref:Cupin domain-containing protein n=1 Tax=Scleromatobacter humisilvae TaxID=2897159 RepID=A0A9X2C2B1_9BURK|nr:cupin domain-containing protein [Scleromatobacter humisilvae]MCK9686629.1 cupin domain-containing protein [Scleromatobacter humisilvae]
MIEHAHVDLLDVSSRLVPFTDAHDPLWSGVMVLGPHEGARLAADACHDLLVLNGTVDIGAGRVLEGGDFAIRHGGAELCAGPAGAQVFAYRDASGARCDEITVTRDERPWREGRTPGMLIANLCTAGHALSLVLWQPGTRTRHHAHPGGEEIFVVKGELLEAQQHPAGSWIRLHPGAWHSPFVETPTLILVRSGHLKARRPAREARAQA